MNPVLFYFLFKELFGLKRSKVIIKYSHSSMNNPSKNYLTMANGLEAVGTSKRTNFILRFKLLIGDCDN